MKNKVHYRKALKKQVWVAVVSIGFIILVPFAVPLKTDFLFYIWFGDACLVRNVTVKFGEDAGRIWSSLFSHGGVLCRDDLLSDVGLSVVDFEAGVGWLAREDKVDTSEKNRFKLK